MKATSFINARMLLCCAAAAALVLLFDAEHAFAARFSRSGVASGGSFTPRSASRPASERPAQPDRVAPADGQLRDLAAARHLADRPAGGDNGQPPEAQPPAPDQPSEPQQPLRDAVRNRNDGPWRDCPPGAAGRACRKYYGYYDYYDDDDHDQVSSPDTYDTLPCAATVITVDHVTYYRCDSTFYTQIVSDGSVLYVECDAPSGY
jgi:hypothetical protein